MSEQLPPAVELAIIFGAPVGHREHEQLTKLFDSLEFSKRAITLPYVMQLFNMFMQEELDAKLEIAATARATLLLDEGLAKVMQPLLIKHADELLALQGDLDKERRLRIAAEEELHQLKAKNKIRIPRLFAFAKRKFNRLLNAEVHRQKELEIDRLAAKFDEVVEQKASEKLAAIQSNRAKDLEHLSERELHTLFLIRFKDMSDMFRLLKIDVKKLPFETLAQIGEIGPELKRITSLLENLQLDSNRSLPAPVPVRTEAAEETPEESRLPH